MNDLGARRVTRGANGRASHARAEISTLSSADSNVKQQMNCDLDDDLLITHEMTPSDESQNIEYGRIRNEHQNPECASPEHPAGI
jgi:hypothetical protein